MWLLPIGWCLALIPSWDLVEWQHDSLHEVWCTQAWLLLFTLFFFLWQYSLDSLLDGEFFRLLRLSLLSLSSLCWLFSSSRLAWGLGDRLSIGLRSIVVCNFNHHWLIWQKLSLLSFRFFLNFWCSLKINRLFLCLGLFLLRLFFLFFLPLHFFLH